MVFFNLLDRKGRQGSAKIVLWRDGMTKVTRAEPLDGTGWDGTTGKTHPGIPVLSRFYPLLGQVKCVDTFV